MNHKTEWDSMEQAQQASSGICPMCYQDEQFCNCRDEHSEELEEWLARQAELEAQEAPLVAFDDKQRIKRFDLLED